MENEEFDVEALNAGLNDTPVESSEETEVEEAETEEITEETADEDLHEEEHEQVHTTEKGSKESKSQRYQRLANERTAEREQRLLAEQRAQLLEQQLEEIRRSQRPNQEEEDLDPLEKWQRDANKTLQQVQMRQQDMDDKSAFLFSVSKNPEEAQYVERVEQELAKARKNGFNPPREQIMVVLMGRDHREQLKKAPAIKREATARVKAATGKPLGTKSNVAPSKSESTEYDRLKDIPL